MPHLTGTPDEIRARIPAVLESWQFTRDNVLRSDLVEPELKQLCFRSVAEDPDVMDVSRFSEREQLGMIGSYVTTKLPSCIVPSIAALMHCSK